MRRDLELLRSYAVPAWTSSQETAFGRREIHRLLRTGYLRRCDDRPLKAAVLVLTEAGRAALER